MILASANQSTEQSTGVEPCGVVVVQSPQPHQDSCDQLRAEEMFKVRTGKQLCALKHSGPGQKCTADVITNLPSGEMINQNAR